MKTQTLLLLALLGAGLFSNCKKEDNDTNHVDADYLVFGKYYGLCGGENCIEVFKIEDGVLYEDSGDTYPGDAPYPGNYVALPSAKYDLAKDLRSKVPAQLFNEPSGSIGIPDAYDQGGFIIEVKENGVLKYWRIDTNVSAIPAYLQPFNDTLRNYIDRISH